MHDVFSNTENKGQLDEGFASSSGSHSPHRLEGYSENELGSKVESRIEVWYTFSRRTAVLAV
nr:unnamed protein product [Callosobruchus chinensis]